MTLQAVNESLSQNISINTLINAHVITVTRTKLRQGNVFNRAGLLVGRPMLQLPMMH